MSNVYFRVFCFSVTLSMYFIHIQAGSHTHTFSQACSAQTNSHCLSSEPVVLDEYPKIVRNKKEKLANNRYYIFQYSRDLIHFRMWLNLKKLYFALLFPAPLLI